MNLMPANRHLHVKPLPEKEEEKQETGVLLPDSYKPQQSSYMAARVIGLAPECIVDCDKGEIIVIERSMLNEINFEGETFYLVLENYVFGRIDK